MFVRAASSLSGAMNFCCSPSTTVAEKLPYRTISSDKRAILDVRRANLCCPKGGYWPLVTPPISDIAKKYSILKAGCPDIPIQGAKRDIDSAFTRCRLHPDAAVLFGTEFELGDIDVDNIIFF